TTLIGRAQEAGIEAIVVSPRLGDFNEDLRLLGIDSLRAASRVQIAAQDVARFMNWRHSRTGMRGGSPASSPQGRRSCFPQRRRGPRPRPSERAIGQQAARTGNLVGRLFSVGGGAAFTSRDKIVGPLRSSAEVSALRCAAGASPF